LFFRKLQKKHKFLEFLFPTEKTVCINFDKNTGVFLQSLLVTLLKSDRQGTASTCANQYIHKVCTYRYVHTGMCIQVCTYKVCKICMYAKRATFFCMGTRKYVSILRIRFCM
jgi:hypothetical protein